MRFQLLLSFFLNLISSVFPSGVTTGLVSVSCKTNLHFQTNHNADDPDVNVGLCSSSVYKKGQKGKKEVSAQKRKDKEKKADSENDKSREEEEEDEEERMEEEPEAENEAEEDEEEEEEEVEN